MKLSLADLLPALLALSCCAATTTMAFVPLTTTSRVVVKANTYLAMSDSDPMVRYVLCAFCTLLKKMNE
jgi:hypothetical protein